MPRPAPLPARTMQRHSPVLPGSRPGRRLRARPCSGRRDRSFAARVPPLRAAAVRPLRCAVIRSGARIRRASPRPCRRPSGWHPTDCSQRRLRCLAAFPSRAHRCRALESSPPARALHRRPGWRPDAGRPARASLRAARKSAARRTPGRKYRPRRARVRPPVTGRSSDRAPRRRVVPAPRVPAPALPRPTRRLPRCRCALRTPAAARHHPLRSRGSCPGGCGCSR